jgi:hypothetical protein
MTTEIETVLLLCASPPNTHAYPYGEYGFRGSVGWAERQGVLTGAGYDPFSRSSWARVGPNNVQLTYLLSYDEVILYLISYYSYCRQCA